MKKFMIFTAVLALALSVFAGCGCRNQILETTPATTVPPLVTTTPTTAPATEATTEG